MPRYEVSAEEARKIRNGSMSEAEWRATVQDMAAHYGWELILAIPDRAYQVLAEAAARDRSLIPALHAIRGFPDLWYGNRALRQAVFLELKTERGAVKAHQREKIGQLQGMGLAGGVWRPRHRDLLGDVFSDGLAALRKG